MLRQILFILIITGTVMSPTRAEPSAEIVAHRGASFDAPENTLAAFHLAWQQNADAVEGDFRLTRDGQIICIHDATTERTTGHKTKIADATLPELKKLDAGSWKSPRFKGEPLPTLNEVLALVPPNKRILIEIKSGPEIIPPLKSLLEKSPLTPNQTIIISFNQNVIAESKREMPGRKAFLLFDFKQKEGKWNQTPESLIRLATSLDADGLDLGLRTESLPLFTDDFIDQLRAHSLELHVWTVNDSDLARQALRLGAQSITTDKPLWLRQQLHPTTLSTEQRPPIPPENAE
jgi:glycerophosphoryl diester phosphodiesterase